MPLADISIAFTMAEIAVVVLSSTLAGVLLGVRSARD